MARKRRVSARVEAWYEAGYRWFRSESGAIVSTLEPGLLWPVKHVPFFNDKEVEENAKDWAANYGVQRSYSAERVNNLLANIRSGVVIPGVIRRPLPLEAYSDADYLWCYYVAPPADYIGEMALNPFVFELRWDDPDDEMWWFADMLTLPTTLSRYRNATIYWPSGKFVEETL